MLRGHGVGKSLSQIKAVEPTVLAMVGMRTMETLEVPMCTEDYWSPVLSCPAHLSCAHASSLSEKTMNLRHKKDQFYCLVSGLRLFFCCFVPTLGPENQGHWELLGGLPEGLQLVDIAHWCWWGGSMTHRVPRQCGWILIVLWAMWTQISPLSSWSQCCFLSSVVDKDGRKALNEMLCKVVSTVLGTQKHGETETIIINKHSSLREPIWFL